MSARFADTRRRFGIPLGNGTSIGFSKRKARCVVETLVSSPDPQQAAPSLWQTEGARGGGFYTDLLGRSFLFRVASFPAHSKIPYLPSMVKSRET